MEDPTFFNLLVFPDLPDVLKNYDKSKVDFSRKHDYIIWNLNQHLSAINPDNYQNWSAGYRFHRQWLKESFIREINSLEEKVNEAQLGESAGVSHYLSCWHHMTATEQASFLLQLQKIDVQLRDKRRKRTLSEKTKTARSEKDTFISDFNSIHDWCKSHINEALKKFYNKWTTKDGPEKAKSDVAEMNINHVVQSISIGEICNMDVKDAKWKEGLRVLFKKKALSDNDDIFKAFTEYITANWTIYKAQEKLVNLFFEAKLDSIMSTLFQFSMSKPGEDGRFSLEPLPKPKEKDVSKSESKKRPAGDVGANETGADHIAKRSKPDPSS